MLKKIQEQVNDIITYSQYIDEPKTDQLMKDWYKNKKHFIDYMNGELIYEFGPVEIDLEEEQKEKRIEYFISQLKSKYKNKNIVDLILENKQGFFENRVVNDFKEAKKGMKLSKSFKFFEKDKYILDQMQTDISRFIQESKFTGILCMSVHPLDFLSLSENTHKWRSCHALDGEYCAGNLSYMCDSATVVFYIKSKEDVILPNFPNHIKWNNKKWRQLFYFSDNMNIAAASKPYPFALPTVTELIRKAILKNNDYYKWISAQYIQYNIIEDCVFRTYNYIPWDGRLIPVFEIFKDKSELHFNDCISSSTYIPQFIYNDSYNPKTDIIKVGHEINCIICGKHKISNSEYMLCNSCAEEYSDELFEGQCECCGRLIRRDNKLFYIGNSVLCEDCAKEETEVCDYCGERLFSSDMIYNEDNNTWMCHDCYYERGGN